MEQARTARELGLGESKRSYEWEAGETPPGDSAPGRWVVAKRPRDWAVLFNSDKGAQYVIYTFPLNKEGERAARTMAKKLVDIAWGKKPEAEEIKSPDTQENSYPA